MTKFIFDLDGTITAQETLPLISNKFGIADEIEILTRETIQGNIPFIESFIKRVNILGKLPVKEIDDLISTVKTYKKVMSFINKHPGECIVATGNLDCWVRKLIERTGCEAYTSIAEVKENKVSRIIYILKKESVVERYKKLGHQVVFIGDGNNDMEAMRAADISIASGLTHYPAKSILSVADYLVFDEDSLCRQLNQLL